MTTSWQKLSVILTTDGILAPQDTSVVRILITSATKVVWQCVDHRPIATGSPGVRRGGYESFQRRRTPWAAADSRACVAAGDVRVMTPRGLGISTQRARAGRAHFALGLLLAYRWSGCPRFCREGKARRERAGNNDLRFAMLCGRDTVPAGSWRPDVVDSWRRRLAPSYASAAGANVLMHNLAFQGVYGADSLARLGTPPQAPRRRQSRQRFVLNQRSFTDIWLRR